MSQALRELSSTSLNNNNNNSKNDMKLRTLHSINNNSNSYRVSGKSSGSNNLAAGSNSNINNANYSYIISPSASSMVNEGRAAAGGHGTARSPLADRKHAHMPVYCTELIKDITETFLEKEKSAVRRFNEGTSSAATSSTTAMTTMLLSGGGAAACAATTTNNTNNTSAELYSYYASPHYLQYQPEVNEKMRMILIDWLIDVNLKFKLHNETFFLTVNLIDRYLSIVNTKQTNASNGNPAFNGSAGAPGVVAPTNYVPRARLQLVGVCALLLAAKYEEIWPPEIKECVHISANTYSREEIIITERNICAALSFRLTVPTAYPFASRLWSVLEGEDFLGLAAFEMNPSAEEQEKHFTLLQKATCFFLEHAVLDYKCLQFTPSQVANACVYLALLTLRLRFTAEANNNNNNNGSASFSLAQLWSDKLQHYSRAGLHEFRGCAEVILEHVHYVPTTKYQAVRRKYSSSKHGEIAKMLIPDQLPQ